MHQQHIGLKIFQLNRPERYTRAASSLLHLDGKTSIF